MDRLSPVPATSGGSAARLGEFEAVMRRHNRRLYRTARAILRDGAEAEDVVQEAYLRAFSHLDEYAGAASLSTWLTRIVVNEALGRLRRTNSVESLEELAETARLESMMTDSFPARDAEDSPENRAAWAEMRRLVEQAIDELPAAFRVVFVLRAVEQMSTEETAESLGIPAETVRSRFHRGRGRLRQALSERVLSALPESFAFDGERCDRMVAAVLARLAGPRPPLPHSSKESEP